MTFEASGSGGRADCNNEGAIIFFSVLKDFSSGGCGNIFENLDRPLPGVVGKFDDISIGPGERPLKILFVVLAESFGILSRIRGHQDHCNGRPI